jgi:hypothetical protein
MKEYEPTTKQEQAIREYLHEAVIPLIEDVLVKKLGQAMSFCSKELKSAEAEKQKPVLWVENLTDPQPHAVTDLKYCSVADRDSGKDRTYIPIYTAPSKREWVGLTDEEVGGLTVFDGLTHIEVPILADFVRAIEDKLKEKNT